MKRADAERAKQIINDWISYQEKAEAIERIAMEGPTVEGKLIEFKGDFPQLSNIKPDVLASKVDRQRRIFITTDERRASLMISVFSDRERSIMTGYEQKRNQYNPVSKKLFTHDDIALKLGMKKERYTALREHYAQVLVDADRMDRARRVLIVSRLESESRTQHIAAQNETVRT